MAASEEDIRIPIAYLERLLEEATRHGCDRAELLESVGIDEQELEGVAAFSAIKYGRLYQRVMWLAQNEWFGMLSGGGCARAPSVCCVWRWSIAQLCAKPLRSVPSLWKSAVVLR